MLVTHPLHPKKLEVKWLRIRTDGDDDVKDHFQLCLVRLCLHHEGARTDVYDDRDVDDFDGGDKLHVMYSCERNEAYNV